MEAVAGDEQGGDVADGGSGQAHGDDSRFGIQASGRLDADGDRGAALSRVFRDDARVPAGRRLDDAEPRPLSAAARYAAGVRGGVRNPWLVDS